MGDKKILLPWIFLFSLFPFLLFSLGFLSLSPVDGEGDAILLPVKVSAGRLSSFRLHFTTGQSGIAKNGGIRIAVGNLVNNLFYGHRWIWEYPNIENPVGENYVTVTGGLDVSVEDFFCENGHPRKRLVLRAAAQPIPAGEEITITFGDRTFGSPGYRVPPHTRPSVFALWTDVNGDGSYGLIESNPVIEVVGQYATKVRLIAPTTPENGAFPLVLKALDYRNRVDQYFEGGVELVSTDPEAALPSTVFFSVADEGIREVEVSLFTPGVHTVSAIIDGWEVGRSNPILTGKEGMLEGYRIFWGDLHVHSVLSNDGDVAPEFLFHYAREISRLDFVCLTDHAEAVNYEEGEFAKSLVESENRPGEFLAFLGFEWTHYNAGHRNCFFKEPPYPVESFPGATDPGSDTLAEFYSLLETFGEVIAQPHSPGSKGEHMDWRTFGGTRQKAAEIYSSHGAFDRYNNFNTNLYEPFCLIYHKNPAHQDPPWNGRRPTWKVQWVSEALGTGSFFAITASSDSHLGKAGCEVVPDPSWYPGGITAVFAPHLTRESVFDAIAKGRCYGTNCRRIALLVKAGSHWMGEEYTSSGPPRITVHAWAANNIIKAEVLARRGNALEAIHTCTPQSSSHLHFFHTDSALLPGMETIYLVRVFEEGGGVAWSSPIRVKRSDIPIPRLRAEPTAK